MRPPLYFVIFSRDKRELKELPWMRPLGLTYLIVYKRL